MRARLPQALASISGVHAPTPDQAREQLVKFAANYQASLGFLQAHLPALWNRLHPCVVAGFSVTRDVATRRLAGEPVGTFLCRLSASSSVGGLALAVRVAADHPHAGPAGVLHLIVTRPDLHKCKHVEVLLREHPDTTHLLDVYSGKRVDKRRVSRSRPGRSAASLQLGAAAGAVSRQEAARLPLLVAVARAHWVAGGKGWAPHDS